MKVNLKPKILTTIVILLALSGCLRVMATPEEWAPSRDKERFDYTEWRKFKLPDTPEKCRKLAKSYRQKAEEYRLEAKVHQQRKTAYQGYKDQHIVNDWMDEETAEFMMLHCKQLVEKYTELADEMESLARKHEEMAERATE